MQITTKVTGNSLTASEFNQIPDELEYLITKSGQTPHLANLTQVAQAVARYSGAVPYNDGGIVNAVILNVQAGFEGPSAYTEGMLCYFTPAVTNTGATDIIVNAIGLQNLFRANGEELQAGDLKSGHYALIRYDGTDFILANRLPYMDVTAFGAVGDGTTDDTTAVQAALNLAKTIFLPAGTYVTDPEMEYPDDCRIIGEGIGVTTWKIRTGSGLGNLLQGDGHGGAGNSNVTIENITFDGNSASGSLGNILALGTITNGRINNCEFTDSDKIGLIISGSSTDVVITGCYSHTNSTDGFRVTASDKVKLIGCNADNNTEDGFTVQGGSTNITFTDCLSDGNTVNGFYAEESTSVKWVGCSALGNTVEGFRLTTATSASPLTEVVLSGCVADQNGSNGIWMQGVKHGTISGCLITNNSDVTAVRDGIRLSDDADAVTHDTEFITITGCTVTDNQGTKTQDHALHMLGNTDSCVVVGNDFAGNDATDPIASTGQLSVFRDNSGVPTGAVTAAGTITIPIHVDTVRFSGTTTVVTITASYEGRVITLIRSDSSSTTFNETGNLIVPGASITIATTYDTLNFSYDAGESKWINTGRLDH